MTKTLCVTSRSCSVLLDPDGLYEAREKHVLYLDGERLGEEYRSVASLFDLEPDTEYELQVESADGGRETVSFRTRKETCTLDVRDFGAKGDGETEDTEAKITVDNALNSLEIMKEHDVHACTVVTSFFHQRWSQMLFRTMAAISMEEGYPMEIIANYNYKGNGSLRIETGRGMALNQLDTMISRFGTVD